MPRPISDVLRDLEVDVAIPPNLSEAVWERLELEPEVRPLPERRRAPDGFRLPVRRPARRRWVIAGAAVTLVAVVLTAVLILVPRPESALAVLRGARRDFRTPPPLTLVVERRTAAAVVTEETHRPQTSDWVFVTAIDFRDPTHWRRETRRDDTMPGRAGTVELRDGTFMGTIDPARKLLSVGPAGPATTSPLDVVDPALHEGPRLDDSSIDDRCTVEDDVTLLGRRARHLRCEVPAIPQEGLHAGARADVFLDAETGLVLRMALPNGSGHTVTSLRYGVRLPDERFTPTVPPGYDVEWTGSGAPPPRFAPRLPAAGTVTSVPFPDARPIDVLPAGGAVVVALAGGEETDLRSGRIARLDPVSGEVQTTVDVPELPAASMLGDAQPKGSPVGVVTELEPGPGVVYAFDEFAQRVHRLDVAAMRFDPDPLAVGDEQRQATDILPSADGLWVSHIDNRPVRIGGVEVQGAVGDVTHLDAAGRETARIALDGAPHGSLVDGFGTLWVSASEIDPANPRGPERAVVYRVDPGRGAVVARIAVPGPGHLAVAANAVWLGAYLPDGGGALVRIDPATDGVTATTALPSAPGDVALDPATGAVWVTTPDGTGVAVADDAGAVTRTVDVGRTPTAIAAGDGAMWVAVQGARAVVRVAG